MKIIILTHGGVDRLLEVLSALENIEVTGVFVETATEPQRTFKQKIRRSIRYDGYWETLRKLGAKIIGKNTIGAEEAKIVTEKQNELENLASELEIPLYKVENYHSEETIKLLKKADADLGILYGTNIIREKVFSIPKLGSINIHQGFAPLYRGGPTVFWELFNGEKKIGITVHFVAAKVDTGDIILQKTLPLEYDFSRYGLDYERFLQNFRASLIEPSARLIAEAVQLIAEGKEPRIKQDTSIGKRYRLPTKAEKNELLRLLKKRKKLFETAGERRETQMKSFN